MWKTGKLSVILLFLLFNEAMCLAETILSGDNDYQKAYLVLGGAGWKLRDFYTGGGLDRHLRYSNLVDILTLEEFIAKANQGEL